MTEAGRQILEKVITALRELNKAEVLKPSPDHRGIKGNKKAITRISLRLIEDDQEKAELNETRTSK